MPVATLPKPTVSFVFTVKPLKAAAGAEDCQAEFVSHKLQFIKKEKKISDVFFEGIPVVSL